jgi:hypothetical protein
LGRTSTLTLGTIIEHGIPMLLMSLTHLPRHNFLDFDNIVVASRTHIVVVVERNHDYIFFVLAENRTIVRFRVSKKPCLS